MPLFSVGCDVSKDKLDVAVRSEDHTLQASWISLNTKQGCDEVIERLRTYPGALIVIEATSHYHYRIAHALRAEHSDVTVINPLITKKFARSGMRKTKTDKVDAELLATIGLQEPNLLRFTETKENMVKKQFAKQIACLKTEKRKLTQRRNQMRGMFKIMDDACEVLVDSIDRRIDLCKEELLSLGTMLRQMTEQETVCISSIPGVGALNASCIAAELGDISRFHDRDQVVAFAGLDPSQHESGSSVRGKSRITKRGSTSLRGTLGQAAWGIMLHNPYFKEYYAKKKQEGKHYYSILVAMSKKLLLIIYGMLKSGALYDASRHPTKEIFTVGHLTAV